jgi:hypothetical protein
MKKLIIFLSSFSFLLFSNNASSQQYPSLAGSVWKINDGKNNDFKFFDNGRCTYGYYDIWYSTHTECNWEQQELRFKISINNNYYVMNGKLNENYMEGVSISQNSFHSPKNFTGYATHIDKWITKEVPKPKLEPRADNRVTEKYLPPKTTVNEPLRGREKAKELFSDKFDSAIKAALGAAFGVLVLFGIDSITGGRIEKKFNLKIAYAIAAFIGWMLTKFI